MGVPADNLLPGIFPNSLRWSERIPDRSLQFWICTGRRTANGPHAIPDTLFPAVSRRERFNYLTDAPYRFAGVSYVFVPATVFDFISDVGKKCVDVKLNLPPVEKKIIRF